MWKDKFADLMWEMWAELVAYVKSWVPSSWKPTSWKGWAMVAVAIVAMAWFFDKIPDRRQIADVPRPLLTSEVADFARKSDIPSTVSVEAFEALKFRVETLEAAAVKPKGRK